MQFRALLVAALAVSAVGGRISTKARLDGNQIVYIENQPVLGGGAGQGALGNCVMLAQQFVDNPDAPKVKNCGTGIKTTVFLRGRCVAYDSYSYKVGKCDTGAAPDTCDEFSPAQDPRFGHYQSYKIEQC